MMPISDDAMLEIDYYGMQGNEFRRVLPNMEIKDFCTFLKNDTAVYMNVVAASNLPPQGDDMCPMRGGEYKVENYRLDLSNATFTLPQGVRKIKLIMYFHIAGKIGGVVEVYFIIE